MAIDHIIATEKFEKDFKKLRGNKLRERIDYEVKRIIKDPETGKPLRYGMKGERTVRIRPYRIIYAIEGNSLILLRFEHRDEVYD